MLKQPGTHRQCCPWNIIDKATTMPVCRHRIAVTAIPDVVAARGSRPGSGVRRYGGVERHCGSEPSGSRVISPGGVRQGHTARDPFAAGFPCQVWSGRRRIGFGPAKSSEKDRVRQHHRISRLRGSSAGRPAPHGGAPAAFEIHRNYPEFSSLQWNLVGVTRFVLFLHSQYASA